MYCLFAWHLKNNGERLLPCIKQVGIWVLVSESLLDLAFLNGWAIFLPRIFTVHYWQAFLFLFLGRNMGK